MKENKLPDRILMGPGPSDAHPRVLRAMATPLLGHLDPEFLHIMNEMKDLLRYVFQTENELTLAMSGTGSAGMETVFVNLLEPGDKAIIGVNGVFGTRMVDVAQRAGAEVIEIKGKWGGIIEPDDIKQALADHENVKLVALVHAETSTGVLQPLAEISELVHAYGALLVCDMVTSLGGVPVRVDQYGVDAAYSGTQKCLSAPPGLSPVTFSKRAADVMANRQTKVQSWYLDLSMIQSYWGAERFYHHTAPISMIYALKEALHLVEEEGLEKVMDRHRLYGTALQAGLEAMGLELLVEKGHRLPQLTSVRVPAGVDEATFRMRLLHKYGIEIGGGLGELKGKIWRIGLMGYNAKQMNVTLLLAAFEDILSEFGVFVPKGEALLATQQMLNQ